MSESSELDMKKEESEPKAEAVQEINKESQVKQEDSEETKKDHTLSDASPSVTYYSPSTPPSLRTRKPSSPPLHSSRHSSIADDLSCASHDLSPTQDKRFSPSPVSLPDSSISDFHCSPPMEDEHFSPMPPEQSATPVVVVNRFQVEPKVVTKVDPGAQEGFVGVKGVEEAADSGGGGSDNRRLRPDVFGFLRTKKKAKLNKALFGLRIIALVLCLISSSVLAADREQDCFQLYHLIQDSGNRVGLWTLSIHTRNSSIACQ